MRKEEIPLSTNTPGNQTCVNAWHFGDESHPKVYIQSSLHADELPGSLAAYYLHQHFSQLEQEGRLKAHIVLVPLCNPVGLPQRSFYKHIGRYFFATGQNFNRLTGLPLLQLTKEQLEKDKISFGQDAQYNQQAILKAMQTVLSNFKPNNTVNALHHSLISLAYDAQIVLDLHCDVNAVMHLYTTPQLWPKLELLSRYLGSQCQILSEDSLANSFDELLSVTWLRLQQENPQANIPLPCASCTVELRGQDDLTHESAQQDAEAIVQYLASQNLIQLDQIKAAPALINPANPLEGVMYLSAPHAGIVVYLIEPGNKVKKDQHIIDIIDPINMKKTAVNSPHDGFVFALSAENFVQAESTLLSLSCSFNVGNKTLSP